MQNNYVVIMAGGIGSRFWPFSRKSHPKQFQDILGTGQTLLQQTVERFKDICPKENIYIVTNHDYFTLVKEQVPFIADQQILLEPIMRNTAPCIAYASYKIAARNPQANLIVAPADHIILKEEAFKETVRQALAASAEQDILVTLGIKPSRPDTGYGYIQVLYEEKNGALNRVKTFTEKPDIKLARDFIESGDFLWNAGIFIWNVQSILTSFRKLLPEIATPFEDLNKKFYSPKEQEAIKTAYLQCRNISIDYGIMEKAENVYVMPAEFGWSDLGTWKSLFEQADKTPDSNVVHGHVMAYDTHNSIIKTDNPDKLIVVQGLENYIVAEKDNVLLICAKDEEQRIKQFVSQIKDPRYC